MSQADFQKTRKTARYTRGSVRPSRDSMERLPRSSGLPRRNGLEMPTRYHPVNHAVFERIIGLQNVIAVYIPGDFIHRLSRRIGKNLVERLTHPEDLSGVNVDVRGLTAKSAHGRLVNQNPRMRQADTLSSGAARKKNSSHRGELS